MVTAALLLAVGAVLGLVENALLPPLPVPGVRLGLANIAVVLALVSLGPRRALLVSVGRVVLVGMLSGSLGGPASLLALSGALSAWSAMTLLASAGDRFSVVGWSVAGAASHVVGQLLAACVVTGSAAPLAFTPVSLMLALVCGLAIGLCSRLLLSRIPFARSAEVLG